jgi:putative selenate reductase
VAVNVENMKNFNNKRQILHIDDYCNECGNCATFCPYDGKPYKDKFTYFTSLEKLKSSENDGFYVKDLDRKQVVVKINKINNEYSLDDALKLNKNKDNKMLINSLSFISTIYDDYSYIL